MRWPWQGGTKPAASGAQPGAVAPIDEYRILQSLVDAVLVLSGQTIMFANAAAHELLGAHVVGQDVRLVLRHPEALAVLAANEDGAIEYSATGNERRRLELRVAHIEEGRRIVQLFDRSARHLAERSRTDFVANASHELRTPLATIRGYTETLLDDEAGGEASIRRQFLATMDREARRMERLISDLMSLSRIEADKFVRPHAVVALDRLVAHVVAEIATAQPDFADRLRADVSAACEVLGDEAQLSQLTHNLIDNARRYGGGSAVEIALAECDDGIRLAVSDHGPGIDPRHLPRLTERFYRVDDARSRSDGGTGLGLAIVKHIVERHRGKLEIESRPGEGTKVSVTLPSASDQAVTRASQS